jgi:hypothetical protein
VNKLNPFVVLVLGCLFLTLPAMARAQGSTQHRTPFDSYSRVVEKIFVHDKSQYSPYTGPDISHWELLYKEEPNNAVYNRKRLGIFSLTPTQRVFVDVLFDPMTEYYEFRDAATGSLIHQFSYYGGLSGALLINGQGIVYQYSNHFPLCGGNETRKFALKGGKLAEVQQPFLYLENAEPKVPRDITLFFSPSASSPQVASLNKGATVKVLTVERIEKNFWFLVKTPLGLTGWVHEGLDITNCN